MVQPLKFVKYGFPEIAPGSGKAFYADNCTVHRHSCMFKRLKQTVVIEVFIHLLFWAFITITPILTHPEGPPLPAAPQFKAVHFIVINLVLAAQFYLNAFLLIPLVLNKRKNMGLYFTLLLLSFVAFNTLIVYIRPHFKIGPAGSHHLHFAAGLNLFPLLAIIAASFAYHYLADQFRVINNKREITNATLVSELAFLRSQISPHFIFNIINSVVALSRVNPVAVEPTLIQLSNLLRYMLYITDEEKVTLTQKEDYLRSYIELQRLRFQEIVRVNFYSQIADGAKTIEPMLLIPFVENAFKHGTGDIERPVIDINLRTDSRVLDFSVRNSYNYLEQNKDDSHGIGLQNVKRRLELLYPGRHHLSIEQTLYVYNVNLKIELK